MANEWRDIVAEALAVVRGIGGISEVPENPPDQISADLFAVGYVGQGRHESGPPELRTVHHDIIIEVRTPHRDLAASIAKLMPFVDSVPNAIMYNVYMGNKLNGKIQNIGPVRCSGIMPLDYGATPCDGIRFTVSDVKAQTALTA
jgi:hypothetical protein